MSVNATNDEIPDADEKTVAYRVRRVGEEQGGYYDDSAVSVGSFIATYLVESEIGQGFVVTIESVSKKWLRALPEFDGF